MTPPSVPVGFDYARALLDIRKRYTYEQIVEFLGYSNVASITRIISGAVPSHPKGEAIYVLYVETFHKKPPMTQQQADGAVFSFSKCTSTEEAA